MSLTPEGEAVVEQARRILGQIGEIDRLLVRSTELPKGLLRVNATLATTRQHLCKSSSLEC